MVSTSANSSTNVTFTPVSVSAASVTAPVSGWDIGRPSRHSAIAGVVTPSTHHPPSRAMPSTASVSSRARAHASMSWGVTCGVSMPSSKHGQPADGFRCVGVSMDEPLGEVGATLAYDGEIAEPGIEFGTSGSRPDVPREGDDGRLNGRAGHRIEGVEQCRRGDVGGRLGSDARGQPRLGEPGHRRLGHHQHGDRVSRNRPPKA